MSEVRNEVAEVTPTSAQLEKGPNYDFIKGKLAPWFSSSTAGRRKALREVGFRLPDWFDAAPPAQVEAFKNSSRDSWSSQSAVDNLLKSLSDVNAFARPKLIARIQLLYKVAVDVDQVKLCHSVENPEPFANAIAIEASLLEAALHNFSGDDVKKGVYSASRRSGSSPYFAMPGGAVLPFTPEQFAQLCRDLDLGNQYQAHVDLALGIGSITSEDNLRRNVMLSQKHAFKSAIDLARLKGDIDKTPNDTPVFNLLTGVHDNPNNLYLDGKPVRFNGLKLFEDTELIGPLIISPDRTHSARLERVIVYIPHDPVSPIKEYASAELCYVDLCNRLRDPDYQQFFSRFVRQEDKGRLFSRLNERFMPFKRDPATGVYGRVADPTAKVPMEEAPISRDLWVFLFDQHLNKILIDTKFVAVSTADMNEQARHAKLMGYLGIGLTILNVVSMFIPPLGLAMLAVMAVQVADEFVEGMTDLLRGDSQEAFLALMDVLEDVVQIAAMAVVGAELGEPVPLLKRSLLLDSLKQIELPNGQTRLWKPDLKPFELAVTLPATAKPGALGLYSHEGRSILPLDDVQYEVEEAPPGQYRLKHPRRAGAYQPEIRHNGAGAWKTELDQPRNWDDAKVRQRLNHAMKSLPPATQNQILTVSGLDDTVLRRLHIEHQPLPSILEDTFKRFQVYDEVGTFAEQIRTRQVPEALGQYVPTLLTELRNWPSTQALHVFETPGVREGLTTFGNIDATAANTLTMTWADVRAGKLPERIVESFSEAQLRELLGHEVSFDKEMRIQALKGQLADKAMQQHERLFNAVYASRETSSDARVNLLKRDFSTLSSSAAKEILRDAGAMDLKHLTEKKTIPLRMREQARWAEQQIRLARAYESLYLEALDNPDSDRLLLHSLETLPGWSSDVRLEVREFSSSGTLRDSIGEVDASVKKLLVLKEGGRYEAYDADGNSLHGESDLCDAVLHALPNTERKALNFEINQAMLLKKALQAAPLAREPLHVLLRENPIRKPPYEAASLRLRGGMDDQSRFYVFGGANGRYRLGFLYPTMSQEELNAMITAFVRRGGPIERHVRALEAEYDELYTSLRRWMHSPTTHSRFSPSGIAQWTARKEILERIMKCWQRSGPKYTDPLGQYVGEILDFSDYELGRHLSEMPELTANFDHVAQLRLSNSGFSDAHVDFLKPFRRVRILRMDDNALTRLPKVIGDMGLLSELSLMSNRIVLRPQDVARLRGLTELRQLLLGRNPLGLVPDISRMPDLHTLSLFNTGISTWPTGLAGARRMRFFGLDMRANVILTVPDYAPGSMGAELLARTQISREPAFMSTEVLDRLRFYIESVGLDPDRAYPSQGIHDSIDWKTGLTHEQWADKQHAWNNVEDEFGSLAFFEELHSLTLSDIFKNDLPYRTDLTDKVWRMLEAMEQNSALREKIFTNGMARTACVDGAAESFNSMGLGVLVHEAYQLANTGLIEAQLVELARGAFRLEELRLIGKEKIQARQAAGETFRRLVNGVVRGTIDDVEVYLAYKTKLAQRLDLPWQSSAMQFDSFALTGVKPQDIDDAFQRVMAEEKSPNVLRDAINQQPFWTEFLESNHDEFRSLDDKNIAWLELKEAQEQWNEPGLSAAEKVTARAKIVDLGGQFNLTPDQLKEGQVMTADEEDAGYAAIKEARQQLVNKLTQEAMDRAKLQRVELEFTVQPQS